MAEKSALVKKYKATATLVWEFESEPHRATELAKARLTSLSTFLECKVSLKVDRVKNKQGGRLVLGEFMSDQVLPFVTNTDERREYVVGEKSYFVRMNSHRYFIFRTSQKCAACGIVGSKMLLEKSKHEKNPHFNLYAEEDGTLVLMTKDHIRARSYGGEDRHSNYQTMCIICNNIKGSDNLNLDSIRHLREIYNEKKGLIPRKRLNLLIKQEKQKLRLPNNWKRTSPFKQGQSKSKGKKLVTKCDLLILEDVGKIEAMSVYESPVRGNGMKIIACVKKGSVLIPQGHNGSKVIIPFMNKTYSVEQGYVEYVCAN